MIRSSTYNSHTDTVPLIPASKAIIDSVAGVQVVNGAFSIDFPDLRSGRFDSISEGLKDEDKEDKIKQVGLLCQCMPRHAKSMQRAGFGYRFSPSS